MTLRGIDDTLARSLKELARDEGGSLNALVLRIIREAAGVEKRKRSVLRHDMDSLAGTWSAEDEAVFLSATRTLAAVDEDLWR